MSPPAIHAATARRSVTEGRDRVVRSTPPDAIAERPLMVAQRRSDRSTCQTPNPTPAASPYQVRA